jgi:hypothetical protein
MHRINPEREFRTVALQDYLPLHSLRLPKTGKCSASQPPPITFNANFHVDDKHQTNSSSDGNTPFEEPHSETSEFETNNRYMKLLAKFGHSLEDLLYHFVSICGAAQSLLQIHLPSS